VGVAGVLLGVDAGHSVTKAALFDLSGRELAVASAVTAPSTPHPRWQERDMDEAWTRTASAIRRCLDDSGVDPAAVLGAGICGHGDGVYLVDPAGRPVRPAILATDSRAYGYADRYREPDLAARVLALTGQVPAAYSPAALLAWLRDHEPGALHRARWTLFCKDWLRLRLTGEVGTDATEASAYCTDVHTQAWSPSALDLFGLTEVAPLLPPVLPSAAPAGQVTAEAAGETGLRAGTPVVAGAHDVAATAFGIGAADPGAASIVLGTFSINQIIADAPVTDARWQARTFLRPGRWLHMSTSPSGAANLEWAVRRFGPLRPDGSPDHEAAVREAALSPTDGAPVYLPFLYGSPHGTAPGAAFAGLHDGHGRPDLLRAVLEGVVFNHRWHVEALAERFDLSRRPVRLGGGGARSPQWSQLLADALDLPVEVTDATEAGSRGAALLAGLGVKAYADPAEAVSAAVRVIRCYEPDPAAHARLDERFARYERAVSALSELS
jgi:L-xylulokinase